MAAHCPELPFRHNQGMSAQKCFLLLAVVVLGCGAQDVAPTAGESRAQATPAAPGKPAVKPAPTQHPSGEQKPIYGLPLDIHIDAPKVPDSIARPSPPIKE